MRRFAFTLAATGLLLVFAPAGALAHHHGRTHHASARHTRFRKFGDMSSQPTTTSGTSSNIGTVQSFTGGVLTILLSSDNSTVSGTVTNDTKIECSNSGQSQGSGDDQGEESSGSDDQSSGSDQGDQSSSGDDQGDSSTSGSGDQGDQSQSSSTSGDDDQSEDQGQSSSSCSSNSLTPGTAIRAAELRISGAGKTWDKVELGS